MGNMFAELHTKTDDEPITINVGRIKYYYKPECGEGTQIFVEDDMIHVRESYDEVKKTFDKFYLPEQNKERSNK